MTSQSRDDSSSSTPTTQPEVAMEKIAPAGPATYPSNSKRIVIMGALYLAIFLVTLDQNIITTAIPSITDEFHSINDIGWYGTAYLLTMCSFQLLMGKVYKFYPAKPIFLTGIIVFEIGSAVCGSAPNSKAFIVGRAILGLGASGMFSGVFVIMFLTVPLRQRPIYQGAFGAVFAVASVIGPLVGGVFTDEVTWRWCFYINIPVGAISVFVTVLVLHVNDQKLDTPAAGWMGKIKQLDPIGNLVFFPGIICLILALQWGGTEYAWSSARIIVLLIICVIFCSAFVGIQIWKQETATVPPRIASQRSIAASTFFIFFLGAGMMISMYYLPIYFQAIKGVSAVKSGIMLLPTILSVVIASIASGILVSKIGYYNPFFILSSILTTIGAGLLSTLSPTSGHAAWIGYQIIFGFGLGFGSQQPLTVAQTVLDRSDIATGSALIMFMRFLGPAIFLSVAQNLFVNGLVSKLTNLPGIDMSAITKGGATDLKNLASGDDLNTLLWDYNTALVHVWYLVTATAAITIIGSVLVEWRSLKARAQEQDGKTVKTQKSDEPKESA